MKSPLEDKSIEFSERILKMSDYLLSKGKPKYSLKTIVEQVTRSGTSIGANIAEGKGAQSAPDMVTKYSIALKEAFETNYWIILLHKQSIINDAEYDSLNDNLTELIKMLVKAIKSLKTPKND